MLGKGGRETKQSGSKTGREGQGGKETESGCLKGASLGRLCITNMLVSLKKKNQQKQNTKQNQTETPKKLPQLTHTKNTTFSLDF